MTRNEFFEVIKGSKSEELYLIELIKLRGFLIEKDEKGYYLSNNSHRDDGVYLNELLTKYSLGYVEEDRVFIENANKASLFENEFAEETQIGGETGQKDLGWQYFYKHPCGFKAKVRELEPFIARYVKSISSCGVFTEGSCDGNHKNAKVMYIQICISGSYEWNELIVKKLLVGKYRLKWDKIGYAGIFFDDDTKYDTYFELNKAAEYLYDNRITLRDIKHKALENYTGGFIRRKDSTIIEDIFVKNASELLDDYFGN